MTVTDIDARAPRTRRDSVEQPNCFEGAVADDDAKPSRKSLARLGQTIDLRQNRTSTLVAALFGAIACTVILGLFFGRFSKAETVRGSIESTGGFARLAAQRNGVVTELFVKQGDTLSAGQQLYALKVPETTSGGESSIETELRRLAQTRENTQAQIDRNADFIKRAQSQQSEMDKERASLYRALEAQEETVRRALEKARSSVARLQALVSKGYATRDSLEAHERTAFEYERQLSEVRVKRIDLKRQELEKRREIEALITEKADQKSAAQNSLASIDIRLSAASTEKKMVIRSDISGRVLAVGVTSGESVEAAQFILAIGNPDAQPVIVLDAPAKAVGLAKVGQRVVLKYDAFPFKTFGIHQGTVTSISTAAVRGVPKENGGDIRPIERQSHYRIEVKPDETTIFAYGERQPLTIGTTLSADIVVEKRRLIDWVLDPIRALQGRT
ncbi:MAG TPA: HlyD family efflux transporter periplasmic adaptor subunit [Methylosinus sp.]|jgi:membrane fusion protein|uniref:HlyD family secretion protein n=1 Tax=Methylosinus sp. TaxID=427 RepID=UPI002F925867